MNTFYTMLLACKMSSLAFCLEDGAKNTKEAKNLSEDQKARKVTNIPSFLEFSSYVFFCQACALGIFFEYSDYKRFIERSHEYSDVPNPIFASLKKLFFGLICFGIFVAFSPQFYVAFCWHDDYE